MKEIHLHIPHVDLYTIFLEETITIVETMKDIHLHIPHVDLYSIFLKETITRRDNERHSFTFSAHRCIIYDSS